MAQRTITVTQGGLTHAEIETRRAQFGFNVIEEKKRASAVLLFLQQFKNIMVIILIGASGFAYFAGHGIDALIIIGIVFLNAAIGFIQEFKAERAIEALRKLLAPKVRVIRNGTEILIDAKELVPDDLIVLQEGDKVSADCELIESNELRADESVLTGESVPVLKDSRKEKNLFMGTQITHGTGRAVVTKIGMATEFGHIATLTAETKKEDSPLQKEIKDIGIFVGKVTVALSVILFLIGYFFQNRELIDTILFAVSVAVAAVPEGLPAIITIALALGVQRLAQKNAIIKQLSSVETLGSTTIICSDKTGTLTKNEMTVQEMLLGDADISIKGAGYDPIGSFVVRKSNADKNSNFDFSADTLSKIAFSHGDFYRQLELILRTAVLCNNAKLVNDGSRWHILGDPTEGALITLAEKAGLGSQQHSAYTKKHELPFDSERKRMTVIAGSSQNTAAFVKGAPEAILQRCTHEMIDGKVSTLTDARRKVLLERTDFMATQALRTIAFAYRENPPHRGDEYRADEVEKDLVLLGVVGMIDPPREEVKEAITLTRRAGIRVFIITGDYGPTALAIAKALGLARDKQTHVISGNELDRLSETELKNLVQKSRELIFARVKPVDKLRIVNALKENGEVVAVTGDGVNDAPALKRADIGIAMGITGTDVSKEAANMVLTDDSFSSIVTAIIEGRTIYENMKKFIFFIFSSNIGELVSIFATIALGLLAPLTAVLLLIINILTDVLPALALGVEPVEKNILDQQPRNPHARIMDRRFVMRYLLSGIWIGTVTCGVFVWSLLSNGWSFGDDLTLDSELYATAATMAFVVLALFQMFQVFNARSHHTSLFTMNPLSNSYLLGAVLISTLATVAFVELPFFQEYLHTRSITPLDWALLFASASTIVFLEETRKMIERRTQQNQL